VRQYPPGLFSWGILRFLVETVRSELRDLDRCERSERRSASPPRATQTRIRGGAQESPDSDGIKRRARSAPVFHSCPGQTDCERRVAGLPVARSDAIPAIDRGASEAAQPRSSAPLTTEARIILERPQGPRPMRAQRASVRISFWGDPRPGFPDLDRTNDGGAVRPRSCSLPSFGQRPVMHKVGGPPPSLCM
jgi:hypothetical protein